MGMAAGVRRNAKVQRTRLANFVRRIHRIAALMVASAAAPARLVRTGGAAMTYGDDCLGVSDNTLLQRRRAVLAATTARNKGRELDIALALTEDSCRQRVDPAFDAHAAPIVRWAEAAWHRWHERQRLNIAIARATLRQPRRCDLGLP